jgi:Tol biopolymer transport system component
MHPTHANFTHRNPGFRLSLALALGTMIPLLVLADPVAASFPGRNGQVAFVLDAGGVPGLWVANADGTHQRRLTAIGVDQSRPAFSADGRSIAFTATVGREPQIFVIKPDGSGRRRLTGRSSGAANPSFSSNGRKVVFDSHDALFVINADGSQQQRLAGDAVVPSFSPDGRRIAFFRPGTGGIWTMSADGSHQRRITAGRSDAGLSFSPDGRRIVFARHGLGAQAANDIYVINTDGSRLRRLGRETDDGFPALAFSPSGRLIAFPTTGGYILVMNATTGSIADKPLIPLASGIAVSLDWGPRPHRAAGLVVTRLRASSSTRASLPC